MMRALGLLGLLALLLISALAQPWPAQAQGPATVKIVPAKILPNDGYQVTGLIWDGVPYSGPLEFELRRCDLAFRSCSVDAGQWTQPAVDGVATMPAGQNFPPGIYLVRFRKPGAAYSNRAALGVDSFATYYGPSATATLPAVGLPVRGSASVFTRAGASDAFTSIAIESDPCPLTPYIAAGARNTRNQRITKSTELMYWGGQNSESAVQYRWCIGELPAPSASNPEYYLFGPLYVESWGAAAQPTPPGVSPARTVDMAALANSTIAVTYPDASGARSPGLLGGLRLDPGAAAIPPAYNIQSEMVEHYALLPRNRKYPVLTGSARQVIHELTLGWTPGLYGSGLLNLWHTEALAPTVPGAVVRMRYIERGVSFDAPDTGKPVQPRWSVVEDWEWGADGAVLKITQWGLEDREAIPGLCWRAAGYNPATPGTNSEACVAGRAPTYLLDLAEYTAPTIDGPLIATLRDPLSGARGTTVAITAAGAYELDVSWPDGKPYSGFLELQVNAEPPALLRDTAARPIYVHRGSVRISLGVDALGAIRRQFALRPYLTNSSLDALIPNPAPRANDLAPEFPASARLTLNITPLPNALFLPAVRRP